MERLQSLKKQKISDSRDSQIADVAWQLNDLSTTEKILYDRWSRLSADWKPSYAAEFSKTALDLASVYMDHGAFLQALKIYDELLERDRKTHGDFSSEVARGLNNRALCLYLMGTTLPVSSDRKKYFDASMRSIETSNSIWHQITGAQAEFNVKNNDALAQLVQRDITEL
ncbi:MAG: hypothetical protein DKT66_21355 [Candidatus Melainabacteria bacterium]|nr:MAG: hypothetical protein DKT66_21355 [Candidatus Melainabacteria bacterium]